VIDMPLIDGEQFDVEDEGGAAGDAWLGKPEQVERHKACPDG
jgi:hypothetical protein